MPPSHRGPPISWASSARVPSCTMGHLVVLDALLTPFSNVWAHLTAASSWKSNHFTKETWSVSRMLHVLTSLLQSSSNCLKVLMSQPQNHAVSLVVLMLWHKLFYLMHDFCGVVLNLWTTMSLCASQVSTGSGGHCAYSVTWAHGFHTCLLSFSCS